MGIRVVCQDKKPRQKAGEGVLAAGGSESPLAGLKNQIHQE